MALNAPVLDDRKFQQIVDEAKKRIAQQCKAWTDHNVSDPGITLIELFAWMTEIMLYRLNQVPDRHYIKFLEMLGITLQPPMPAYVPITFWLAAPQANPVKIGAGTEVASTQTETESSIVFTTDRDLLIQPPLWAAVVTGGEHKPFQAQRLSTLKSGFEPLEIFTTPPELNEALYFGFDNDMSDHILRFELDCDHASGLGANPKLPPYVWEAATRASPVNWAACDVEHDTTDAMNIPGFIQIHLPKLAKTKIDGKELYWVRVRIAEAGGEQSYRNSPKLRQVTVAAWGGKVTATHARKVTKEALGQSDGAPGQRFQLQHSPVLNRRPGHGETVYTMLTMQVEGEPPQSWTEVADFVASVPQDHHYTLDHVSAEVRFGPAIRQPDGTIKLYGSVPSRGANLIMGEYWYGGGQAGNVGKGFLNTPKTAIPYIDRLENRVAAQGGLDAETLDAAMLRAPAMLRARERAVTPDDFEFHARQALPASIGRVKCLQTSPAPGATVGPQVILLIIPRLADPVRPLTRAELTPPAEDLVELRKYLDDRRLLTVQMDIQSARCLGVAVKVQLRTTPDTDHGAVEQEVLLRLYRFLNPLTGGPDGAGWPFDRGVMVADLYQCLLGIPGVQFIRNVEMYDAEPGGDARGQPIEIIEPVARSVIASGKHRVEFV